MAARCTQGIDPEGRWAAFYKAPCVPDDGDNDVVLPVAMMKRIPRRPRGSRSSGNSKLDRCDRTGSRYAARPLTDVAMRAEPARCDRTRHWIKSSRTLLVWRQAGWSP